MVYGGIISSGNLTHEYNASLGLGRIYGDIITNAAMASYGGNNLFQVSNYRPSPCAWTVYNNNQGRGHDVIFNGTQCQYADVTAISGAVRLYMDILYKIDT